MDSPYEDFFCRLPIEWLVDFISNWLNLEEISLLDVAFTNHKSRPHFLECLRASRNIAVEGCVIVADVEELEHDDLEYYAKCGHSLRSYEFLHWISERNIYVETIKNLYKPNEYVLTKVRLHSLREVTVCAIDDKGLTTLVDGACPGLRSISFVGDIHVTAAGLMTMLDILGSTIETFRLIGNDFVDDGQVEFSTVEVLRHAIQHCGQLKAIGLGFLFFNELTSEALESLVPFAHLFTELRVQRSPFSCYGAFSFANFIEGCVRLTSFVYQRDDDDDDEEEEDEDDDSDDALMLQPLVTCCPLLSVVHLINYNHFTDDAIRQLSLNCPALCELHIEGDHRDDELTSAALVHIGRFSLLQRLYLDSISVTDEGLTALAQLPLESLTLLGFDTHNPPTGATRFTGSGIGAFAGAPIAATLTEFVFDRHRGNVTIDESLVAAGLRACGKLETVKGWCGDAIIRALADGCPLLKLLTVTKMDPNITQDTLKHLATCCPKLGLVDLRWGTAIATAREYPNQLTKVEVMELNKEFMPKKLTFRMTTYY